MPDRKKKPYHPRHFPDPKDPGSIGGFVVAANNGEYAFYHSGTSQDALENVGKKPIEAILPYSKDLEIR